MSYLFMNNKFKTNMAVRKLNGASEFQGQSIEMIFVNFIGSVISEYEEKYNE